MVKSYSYLLGCRGITCLDGDVIQAEKNHIYGNQMLLFVYVTGGVCVVWCIVSLSC